MSLRVITQGNDWIVVEKPTGLHIRRRDRPRSEPDVLCRRVKDLTGKEAYPVNQIASSASGCVLFVLNKKRAKSARAALQKGTQTYLTLVRGVANELSSSTAIQLSGVPGTGEVEAKTDFRVLATSAEPRCSLVVAQPSTNHRDQVQRHLRRLGHPVLGDRKYCNTKTNRDWRALGLHRAFLHCARLQFDLDGPVEVAAPLPNPLGRLLAKLPFAEEVKNAEPALFPKSYPDPVTVVDNVSYDSEMLEAAEASRVLRADGQIDIQHAKRLLITIKDNDTATDLERNTLSYIRQNFPFTAKAERWFTTEFRAWESSS